MPPKIAILYICHNTLAYLPEVVRSWETLEYPRDRVTIVLLPAGATDGTVEYLQREVVPRAGKDLPEVVLLNEPNRGFSANNNVGLRWALANGADYAYLQNGDLKLTPTAMTEVVRVAEAWPDSGSVQSLVCLWNDPERVNASGGMVHVAGYGYVRDNGRQRSDIAAYDGEEIAYASGAAVLYRAGALRQVGLLEEGFFMYHEDVELGLRLRIAGYTNRLALHSVVYHDYRFFGSNEKKFAWMELYRLVVIFAYYRWATMLFLAPFLLLLEMGSWLMAIRGDKTHARAKCWAVREWVRPRTWRLWWTIRRRAQRLRVITDRQFLHLFTGRIEGQEIIPRIMDKVINPLVDCLWKALRTCIVW